MKTTFLPSTHRSQRQNGSAVLIVIILLGAMLVLIASNTRNLNQLKREIDWIEQKQLKRQATSAVKRVSGRSLEGQHAGFGVPPSGDPVAMPPKGRTPNANSQAHSELAAARPNSNQP